MKNLNSSTCKAEKSKQDLKTKDIQIKKMEETIHGLDMKVKEKDLRNKNLQEKVTYWRLIINLALKYS